MESDNRDMPFQTKAHLYTDSARFAIQVVCDPPTCIDASLPRLDQPRRSVVLAATGSIAVITRSVDEPLPRPGWLYQLIPIGIEALRCRPPVAAMCVRPPAVCPTWVYIHARR